MATKAGIRITNKEYHLENNILTLEFDVGDYDLVGKTVTAVFAPTQIETGALEVDGSIIKLSITSGLIEHGINYIQLNFRWNTDKLEQSGKMMWVIDMSLPTTEVAQETVDIISYLVSIATTAKTDADDLVELVTLAEGIRVSQENNRKDLETIRVDKEVIRESNEGTRKSNEITRIASEVTRGTNETNRGVAEGSRVTVEGSRVIAETTRVNQEAARVIAENGRLALINSKASQVDFDAHKAENASHLLNYATQSNIKGTIQSVAFNPDKSILRIEHSSGSNILRNDSFTYATNLITEVRTLSTGQVLTLKHHLDTFVTEVI